jgi:soluble lytic murein transglycosylase-like protein
LNRQQAAVATWLAKRYRVAPEPISRLVQEAWSVGERAGLDPTLILAIMAVESSFNPFAQSPVGAQGLMQVMTKVHDDKYSPFGGVHAAFDPVTNLRVGVQVLKECIARAGSLEAGLKFYVGAGNMADDGGYAGKVLAEQSHLRLVAGGKTVSPTAAIVVAATASASATADAGKPTVAPLTLPVVLPKPDEALPVEKVALLR